MQDLRISRLESQTNIECWNPANNGQAIDAVTNNIRKDGRTTLVKGCHHADSRRSQHQHGL
jgi:hypothetical protein